MRSTQSLYNGMRLLLEDEAPRRSYAQRGSQYALDTFHITKVADQYEALYASLPTRGFTKVLHILNEDQAFRCRSYAPNRGWILQK